MIHASERRASRRFTMSLPVTLRLPGQDAPITETAETRDVGFRGLYFTIPASLEAGDALEFVLTLPKEVTLAGDVHIRCFGEVIRVDHQAGRYGVAAKIDRFEFLPSQPTTPSTTI